MSAELYKGKPCKNGHAGLRYAANSNCVDCAKSNSRTYRSRDTNKARRRELYKSNPRYREARTAWGRNQLAAAARPCPPVCEVCGRPPGKKSLHLDHDHTTKTFRGWLCGNCNCALGHAGDSPSRLRALADYLENATRSG